jgi:hypothetical protein
MAVLRIENANRVRILGYPHFYNPFEQTLIVGGQITGYRGDSSVTSAHAVGLCGGANCELELDIENFATCVRLRAYNRATEWGYRHDLKLRLKDFCFGVLGGNQWMSRVEVNGLNAIAQVRPDGRILPPHSIYWAGGPLLGIGGDVDSEEDDPDTGDFSPGSDTPSVGCVFVLQDDTNIWSSAAKWQGLLNCVIHAVTRNTQRGLELGRCQNTQIISPVIQLLSSTSSVDAYRAGINIALSRGCTVTDPLVLIPNNATNTVGMNIREKSERCWVRGGQVNLSMDSLGSREILRVVAGCEDCGFEGTLVTNRGTHAQRLALISSSPRTKMLGLIVDQPETPVVTDFTISSTSVDCVIRQNASDWKGPALPSVLDQSNSAKFFFQGFDLVHNISDLPAPASRPSAMVRLTDGTSPDAFVYSDGKIWRYMTGAPVQNISVTSQPGNASVGGLIRVGVSATNVVRVNCQIENSNGEIIGPIQTIPLVGGGAVFQRFVTNLGSGYRVRVTSPSAGNIFALSNPFSVNPASEVTFNPVTELGSDLVAWLGTLDSDNKIVQTGTPPVVSEWRANNSSTKKLVSFGSSLPTLRSGRGVTGDRKDVHCLSGALYANGNWPELVSALDGDLLSSNFFFAISCAIPANNRTIVQWRGTNFRYELRANGSSPWQLVVQGPTGSTQTYFTGVGVMDGAPHVVAIGKIGPTLTLWVDTFNPSSPTGTATISGTSGSVVGSEIVFNATGAIPFTPHTVGGAGFFGFLGAKGVLSDNDRLGIMQVVAREAGISIS